VPAGQYDLTRNGSETSGNDYNDLDILANVTIVGAGPGLTVIDADNLTSHGRIFDVADDGVLNLSGVTLQLGDTPSGSQANGGAIRVQNGGELNLRYSAIVGNDTGSSGTGGAIYFAPTAEGSIEASVITVNTADEQTGGIYLEAGSGAVTIKSTIVANNNVGETDPDIYAGSSGRLQSLGYNRFTSYAGFSLHGTDYVGTVNYVVTSVADTYDGDSDAKTMSLRDAIHQANTTAGAQEIWLPAWEFILTRDRATYGGGSVTDTSVAFGDLDIGKGSASEHGGSLTIRGVNGSTSVAWAAGLANDKVFELLGDYNEDGVPDESPSHVNADDGIILDKNMSAADGDDDGDYVDDEGDQQIYDWNFGTTLTLYGFS
jgi:CSLREA domain-containing protein